MLAGTVEHDDAADATALAVAGVVVAVTDRCCLFLGREIPFVARGLMMRPMLLSMLSWQLLSSLSGVAVAEVTITTATAAEAAASQQREER